MGVVRGSIPRESIFLLFVQRFLSFLFFLFGSVFYLHNTLVMQLNIELVFYASIRSL